ncbi:ankyrin repeat domain-containing protein, partial [Burkholderia gladioli]
MDITTTKRLTPQEAQEALFHATNGDEVGEAIRQGGDVNRIDDMRGFSPFHNACRSGNGQAVEAMIANGADVHAPVPTGLTLVLDTEDMASWERDQQPKEEREPTLEEAIYIWMAGKRPVDLAIENPDPGVIDALLDEGASIERSPHEQPVIHQAMEEGNFAVVEALLDRGMDVDQPDPTSHGQTLLHRAASRFLPAHVTMDMLLDHDADIDALDDRGRSPLVEAMLNNTENAALGLMKDGADTKAALSHPDLATQKWTWGNQHLRPVVEQDEDDVGYFDDQEDFESIRNNVETLHTVHIQSAYGDEHGRNEDVDLMIRGAYARQNEPYVSEAQGWLHHAATSADVERGIKMGGDVNLVNPINGMSPFHETCFNNDVGSDVVEAMLKHGANLEAPIPTGQPYHRGNSTFGEFEQKDVEGLRPLELALERGGGDKVKTLLNAGASIERGPDEVPLICRARGDDVKLLLEAGSDAAAINWHKTGHDIRIGDTALHVAARNGNTANVKTLIDYGAPVDGKNTLGETPLVGAIREDSVDAAKLLIKRGADPALALNHPTITQAPMSAWTDTDRDDRPWAVNTKALEVAHAADGRTNLHAERVIRQAHDQVDHRKAEQKQEQVAAKQQAQAERKRIRIGM